MRAFVIGVAAFAFGVTLSACTAEKSGALAPVKTDPAAVEKLVASLAAESFKGKATAAADVASVRDALPREVALSWGALNFDQASGATVLTAVKFTPADMPNVGVSVDEIRLWDFNAEFAKARLSGQRLAETASLARRVELKGAKVFGIETLMGPVVEATEAVVEEAAPAGEFAATDLGMKLENYEIGVGRMILDDLTLRPFELTPAKLEPGSEFAEFLPILQHIAAVSRTFATNASATYDLKVAFAMTQLGQKMSMDVSAKTLGSRGARGGDVDVSFARGMSFAMEIPADQFSGTPAQKMAGAADFYTIEDVRLDKLYGYLARGEWPPRTEANLLSLGRFASFNTSMSLNDAKLYTSAEEVFDAREFHWFIPTKLSLSAKDVSYDVGAFVQYVSAFDPSFAANGAQVMDVLARNGFQHVTYDSNLSWDWNAQSGAAKVGGAMDLETLFSFDLKYEGALPTFKGVSDLVPDNIEQTDGAAIGALFEKASTLKLVDISIVDNGGLEKSFGLAAELAALQPSDPNTPNPMANMTPEALRSMAVAGAYMMADQAAAQVPTAKPLITPLAAFIEKGGRVKITLAPKAPVPVATLANSVATGQTSPDAAIEQLNIKVEHLPPAGK